MPRIIDLSMAIVDHFRWPVERRLNSDHGKGDLFQVTWLGWPVHGFTHMDSPRHFFADGRTTSDVPLEATVGEAAVVDLTPLAPNEAITAGRLAGRAAHVYLATAEAVGATVATADRRFFSIGAHHRSCSRG